MAERYGDWRDYVLCMGVALLLGAKLPMLSPKSREDKPAINTGMKREDKFGYGFLMAGIGAPYLMDKYLGGTAAMMTAAVCLCAGIGFILAGHFHERKIPWKTVRIASLFIVVAIGIIWWIVAHPDMEAVIVSSASGEIMDLPQPATAIALLVDALNAGKSPSITRDWKLVAKLKTGEIFNGLILHKRPTFDTNGIPFLDEATASSPIQSGGEEHGLLMFGFPNAHQDSIDNADTVLVLSFKDVKGRTFTTKYRFPAQSVYGPNAGNPAEELVTPHRHNVTVRTGLHAAMRPGSGIYGDVRILSVQPAADASELRLLLIARIIDGKKPEYTDTSIEKSAICPLSDQVMNINISHTFEKKARKSNVEVYTAVLPSSATADQINNLADVQRMGGFVGATWIIQP